MYRYVLLFNGFKSERVMNEKIKFNRRKNKLEWLTINDEMLDNSKFAGNYNIPHIIRQIKIYLKNEM